MAGTIPLSMTQQFDEYGKPLKGGQLYIIQANTVSTPQDAFVDTGLTIKQPYPMVLDAAGRVPQFFLADGTVKVRLQSAAGVVQLSADQVLVIGPSSGGGGGSSVDQTQLIQTGMMMFEHSVADRTGFIKLNGLTIGSVTSSASQRRNADCRLLFLYLWQDATLTVLPARGASGQADWDSDKQIAVPDWRGYALSGLDDMGNAPIGRLTPGFFGAAPTILGAVGGAESRLLTPAQCALVSHAHNMYLYDPGHAHYLIDTNGGGAYSNSGNNAGSPLFQQAGSNSNRATTNVASGVIIGSTYGVNNSTTTSAGGSANASASHAALGPRKLLTFYMKL